VSAVVIAVILGLLVNEMCDLSPWLANRLAKWAAHRWTSDPAAGDAYAEEWASVIHERPGKLFKLMTAAGFACAALARAQARWLNERRGNTKAAPSARSSTVLFALVIAVLTSAFYAVPGLHMFFSSCIGVASAAAIAIGVRRNKPRRRLPWLALGAATFNFTAGDTTYNILTTVLHQQHPFPSVVDAFYVLTAILQIVGLVAITPLRALARNRAALLDALAVTPGLSLFYWVFLINPYLSDTTLSSVEKLVSVFYPTTDVLILGTTALMLMARRRSPSTLLLALGSLGLATSDVIYGLGWPNGAWGISGLANVGWIVLYATWGLAALHPTMADPDKPATPTSNALPPSRLLAITLSALIAPLILLIEAANHRVVDGVPIAVVVIIVMLLAFARLRGRLTRRAPPNTPARDPGLFGLVAEGE
jgi:hypothetical protein